MANETAQPENDAPPQQVAPNNDLLAAGRIAEKLDEMADICEHWKRNREKGREPNAIRTALIMLSGEVVEMAHYINPEKEKAAKKVAERCGFVGS